MENLSEYQSLNHDQKSLSKRHKNVYFWCQNSICRYNWCQDTIGFKKGSLIEGEQDFTKSCHGSLKLFHFERWSEHGYVSLNEFFMSFSLISKSFKTHSFWHITILPIMNWGGARKLFKYQTRLNQTTFLFPKCFSTNLNQLRSKISKGLIF